MSYGFDLLIEQAVNDIASTIEAWSDAVGGDSEIEKLFVLALITDLHINARASFPMRLPEGKGPPDGADEGRLFYRHQEQVDEVGMVDFVIYVLKSPTSEMKWRRLIVECDGHDFHERTKEQAANDRSRDRAALLAGYDFMRFTGSELWRNPLGCAMQARKWIFQGEDQ